MSAITASDCYNKQILTRKIWDYTIDMKEEFVLRKRKIYSLSREEREEV